MKTEMKKNLTNLAKTLIFAVLFVSLFAWTRDVLRDKSHSQALDIILQQEDDTYDVILAGPSHMQHAVHPAQLFGEYGIAACNTSTAAQSIPTSYYVLREVIEKQDPELVVLDLFCMFYPEAYFSSARFHQAIDNFPLSRNKLEAIYDLAYEDRAEFILDYLLYHERWKVLTEEDFTGTRYFQETYQLLEGVEVFPEPFTPVPVSETEPIPELPLLYLKKIVELCRETDTRLLLTVIPYRADVDNNDTSALYQQRIFNAIAGYAEEWGVDYLNGLHYLEEMGFDFSTDMVEYSHVNGSGSYKVSAFYGRYLSEHYDLPNRAQDPAYTHWYDDYRSYLQALEAMQ